MWIIIYWLDGAHYIGWPIAFPTCVAPCDCVCMAVLSKDLGEFWTPHLEVLATPLSAQLIVFEACIYIPSALGTGPWWSRWYTERGTTPLLLPPQIAIVSQHILTLGSKMIAFINLSTNMSIQPTIVPLKKHLGPIQCFENIVAV